MHTACHKRREDIVNRGSQKVENTLARVWSMQMDSFVLVLSTLLSKWDQEGQQ